MPGVGLFFGNDRIELEDGGLIFNQTADGTYAGNMAGTGSLTKSGAGTLTLTGATGYSGGTFITAGTLEGNSANLQGSISNLGQLRFNQALDGTFTGSIGGTGSVTKTGAGMLVLNGANAYTGGTTVSGGSLVGDVTSLQGDILNDATLVFNQLSDATFTGNLSGSGVLVKAGGATLTLGGSNTQTGGTVIQAGALVANTASLFGPVLDKVVTPDVVRIFRPQPDAGSVVEPEPPLLRLLLRHFQPLLPPDPLHPFAVHFPAGIPQKSRDAPIAIAAILESKRDDVGGQGRLVIWGGGDLALGGAVLAENPADPSLGQAQFGSHVLHARTAAGGA